MSTGGEVPVVAERRYVRAEIHHLPAPRLRIEPCEAVAEAVAHEGAVLERRERLGPRQRNAWRVVAVGIAGEHRPRVELLHESPVHAAEHDRREKVWVGVGAS